MDDKNASDISIALFRIANALEAILEQLKIIAKK